MSIIDDIFSILWDIAWYFWEIRYEVRSIPIVGQTLSTLFYQIYKLFMGLATGVANFGDWLETLVAEIEEIVSFTDIWQHFKSYFQAAQFAWSWVQDAFTYVTQWTVEWWYSTSLIVQSWITIATQGFSELVTAWSSFTTVTLPTLVSFDWLTTWWNNKLSDIEALISTAFILREGLWSGWQDWRGKVTEFFTDPEDWLYKAIDRIIERFW